MTDLFERLDLVDLTTAQLAPLEARMDSEWPDTWRELATSHYVTLISAPGSSAVATDALAALAVALTMGVAQDMGGTQPYIPVGDAMMKSARTRRAIELLDKRMSYKEVADATGLTAVRVRRIERAWRDEQYRSRQSTLPLG